MIVCTGTQQTGQTSFTRSNKNINIFNTTYHKEEYVVVVIKYMRYVMKYRSFIQAQISLYSFLCTDHDSKKAVK